MTLTHGADTASLTRSGGVLRRKAGEVDDLAGQASRAAKHLASEWRGPDSDAFARSWQKARTGLTEVSTNLTSMAKTLDAQAKGQDSTSEDLGGAGGGSGGSGSDGQQAYIAPVIDDWGDESQPHPLFPSVSPEEMSADKSTVDGTLDPAVEERWHQMSREEKEETIRALVQERAEANDVAMPQIDISDLQHTLTDEQVKAGKEPGLGYWDESRDHPLDRPTMRIREDQLDNPRQVIAIIGHEMRHAGQREMTRDSDMGWLERQFRGEPFTGGLSPEQVEIIGQNNAPGEYRTADEDGFNAYHYQPVEVDARNAGKAYVDGMTVEQLERRKSPLDLIGGPFSLPRNYR